MTDRTHGFRKEQNIDQLLEHDYDGIQEYDNKLPNWWLFIMYGSIVFAIGYWLVFETMQIVPNPLGRYELKQIEATEAQLARMAEGGLTNESLELMATLPTRVSEGEQLFRQYCVVCHLELGQGVVGPNLTDRYWVHGPEPLDIHYVVTNGVAAKGMAAWGRQLGPSRVEAVVAYVLTLRNTEVPGKAPEGVLYADAPTDGEAAAGEQPDGDQSSGEPDNGAPADSEQDRGE
ncbi:MAG: cbb3-type cytochrome c oxidase N-terminal domain-containing protein [bacterium]